MLHHKKAEQFWTQNQIRIWSRTAQLQHSKLLLTWEQNEFGLVLYGKKVEWNPQAFSLFTHKKLFLSLPQKVWNLLPIWTSTSKIAMSSSERFLRLANFHWQAKIKFSKKRELLLFICTPTQLSNPNGGPTPDHRLPHHLTNLTLDPPWPHDLDPGETFTLSQHLLLHCLTLLKHNRKLLKRTTKVLWRCTKCIDPWIQWDLLSSFVGARSGQMWWCFPAKHSLKRTKSNVDWYLTNFQYSHMK